MGWSFRKSVNLGPFRVNVSRSGLGYSVGAGGFRTGVRSNGRSYSSVSIPGTGVRYTSGGSRRKTSSGCLVMVAAGIGLSFAAGTLFF